MWCVLSVMWCRSYAMSIRLPVYLSVHLSHWSIAIT